MGTLKRRKKFTRYTLHKKNIIMKISILAVALVACYMSFGVEAQFGLGLAGLPFVPPIVLPRFGLGGLFGLGFPGFGFPGFGFPGLGFPGLGFRGRFGFGGRFRRGGRSYRGKRDTQVENIEMIEQEEMAQIEEINKEIQTLTAFNRTICAFDFEESKIRCDRAERGLLECEVEPRLDVLSEMTRIRLPSLSMTQVPLTWDEKEIPAINLYSPVKHDSTMAIKNQKIILSIYDKEDIKLPGWFVKDSKCFERLNGMISSEILTKVFPRFSIDWVREE